VFYGWAAGGRMVAVLMPRIRTLKPEVWLSPQVMNLTFGARLLFIGLITQADDQGRGISDPRRLKAAVLPADDVTASQVEEWLREIEAQRLAVLYDSTVHGRLYSLPSWSQHQSINKAKDSAYPPPPGVVPEADGTDTGSIRDDSRGIGRDRKGSEGKGRALARAREFPGLDTAAWDRWLAYRQQIRHAILEASAEAAAKKLASFGANQSAVVEQSIANGWQGLFELKASVNGAMPHDAEALRAWHDVLDEKPRTPRMQRAVEAAGGWQRIRTRTENDAQKVQAAFMRAYRESE